MDRPLPSGDQTLLRRLNAGAVLRFLRGQDPVTLTEIVRGTGLSRPTVQSAVATLVDKGLLDELPAAPPRDGLGRPARRYRFRAEAGYVLGLDIGAHKVLGALADLNGDVVSTRRAPVAEDLPAAERLAVAREVARRCIAASSASRTAVRAVGVGTPGIVDNSGRVIVTDVLPEWTGMSLAEQVARSFACPVLVENDANLAALAEQWQGAAMDVADVVYVLVGARFGASILINGRPHRGHSGAAGEIAFGDFLGMRRAMEQLQGYGPPPSESGSTRSPNGTQAAFTRALDGDRDAQHIVSVFTQHLAMNIAAMALTVDPELVVIGGGISKAAAAFIPELERNLDRLCAIMPRIAVSTMGDESVAIGAVRIALDHVDNELLPT